MSDLTHFDDGGRPRMVDVGAKPASQREAVARGRVRMAPETLSAALGGTLKKGDVRPVAELAGIMAAKKTADLIPLCHPLSLSGVDLQVVPYPEGLEVTASVRTTGPTGVEMEALTAVSIACLTIYDMLKALDKAMVIETVQLVLKRGGRSGEFRHPDLS